MAPVLYMVKPSPPVRSVQICAKHLGIDLELKELNFREGEHLKPEFLKLNPSHTVPVLVDEDGTTIFDSHAINIYLLKKYADKAKQTALYPDDAKSLALIHQIMHFESSYLFGRGRTIMFGLIGGKKEITSDDLAPLIEGLGFLDEILKGRKYAIGAQFTLADMSLFTSVTSMTAFDKDLDFKKYQNVHSWLQNVQDKPGFEQDQMGLAVLKGMVAHMTGGN